MDKPKKKVLTAFILMVIIAAAVIVLYYFISKPDNGETQGAAEPGSEIEKLIQKDLDTKYPATPSEVVKLYWRFNKCMYNTGMSDKNFEQLLEQLRKLYDEEFLAREDNSWENMLENFKKDRDEYMRNKKIIAMYTVEPSSSAAHGKVDDKDYVTIVCTTMIKQKAKRTNLVERFMCRCDENGNWKILGWEQISSEDNADSSSEDA